MPDTSIGSTLTDGTGVSSLTVPKVVKDLVADILLSGAAALVAVNIVSLDGAVQQPTIAAFAVGGAVIRAVYRATLKWATSQVEPFWIVAGLLVVVLVALIVSRPSR